MRKMGGNNENKDAAKGAKGERANEKDNQSLIIRSVLEHTCSEIRITIP